MTRMPRVSSPKILAFIFVIALAAGAVPGAFALDDALCSMEILVDGAPVSEYSARRGAYIEALPGREYSIRLANRTGSRIAVALSVDGLNSIDAKVASARDASKWILGPYETVVIEGWQTSSATARRFFFTTENRSYGAWLGETKNLGLIAAAVFREKPPVPVQGRRYDPAPYHPGRSGGKDRKSSKENETLRGLGYLGEGMSDTPATEQPEGSGSRSGDEDGRKLRSEEHADSAPRDLSDDLAATGIGRELDHQVVRVRFDQENAPAAVMEVRYEYRAALVRLGVLPRCAHPSDEPLARRERARGFEDTGYAPDPYCRRR